MLRWIFRYLARFLFQLTAILFGVLSLWVGAWFPDAQQEAFAAARKQNSDAKRPGFVSVVRRSESFSLDSPVPYTAAAIFANLIFLWPSILASVGYARLEKREKKFREEEESHSSTRQRFYFAVHANLVHLIPKSLPNFDDTCRISIYRCDDEAGILRMIFRYSNNSTFNSPGRVSIPASEGVAGAVMANGDYMYMHDLPDPGGRSSLEMMRYYNESSLQLRRVGVTLRQETLSVVRMLPRCIFGYAIRDPETNIKYAVVILESLNPNQFDKDRIVEGLVGNHARILSCIKEISGLDRLLNPYGAQNGNA